MTLILLLLTRKSREAAFNCKMDDLEQENGMDTLIDVLDDLFMKELSDSPYMYETRLSLSNYTGIFDQRFSKIVQPAKKKKKLIFK